MTNMNRGTQSNIHPGAKETDNSVSFLDLITPHRQLQEELVSVFKAALSTAGFIGGPMLEGFEKAFAEYCHAQHCVGVANGTEALLFALLAGGIKAGDAVITVPNTFIATTEAICQAGAQPEFVDVDELTHNMDSEKLREFLEMKCEVDAASGKPVTKKGGRPVTAIVPVHLYGQPADMDAILELAERYGLAVIEDACQAHGAEYFSKKGNCWQRAGSIGRAAAFSFYPGKNLGACGEAGAVTTNDEGLAAKIRMLRDHGQSRKYHHQIEGYNGRMDAIQAGFLGVKLPHLNQWNQERRERAERYRQLLVDLGNDVIPCVEAPWAKSNYHLFVVRVQQRDQLIAHLAADGIATGIHYPIPLHLQNAYTHLGYKAGDFPVCERMAQEILSLPMHPSLTAEQQQRVIDRIRAFTVSRSNTIMLAA